MSKGDLELIIGPMFSGKTSELIRRYSRNIIAEKNSKIIRYTNDNRYSLTEIVTHNGIAVEAVSCQKLFELELDSDLDTLFIDEVQFYPDAYEFCLEKINEGINLVVSGLNGTFERVPFPVVSQLVSLATGITYCKSICHYCKKDNGCYSKRITKEVHDIVIGGTDKYRATCKDCYNL